MFSLKALALGVRQKLPFAWGGGGAGKRKKSTISGFFNSGQSMMLGYQKLGKMKWAKRRSVSYIFKRPLCLELIW